MKTSKIIITLSLLLSIASNINAQTQWSCNPYAYEHDMAIYFSLLFNEDTEVDMSNFELAAFCKKECRGVGDIQTIALQDGTNASFGYIRIYSNNIEGDTIYFRVFDKVLMEERDVEDTLVFQNQELIGLPSSPKVINFYDERPVTITAKSYTRSYGEENPVFEYVAEGFELKGIPEITCEAVVTSPVGEYPIIIARGTVKNKKATFINGILTVTQAPGSISYRDGEVNKTYGDAPFTNELTLIGDGSVTYSSSDENVAVVNPSGLVEITGSGEATIKATVVDGVNYSYAVRSVSYVVKVAKADMTVTAESYSGTYDGKPHGINVTVPEGAVVKYGETDGNYTSESNPTYIHVGTKTVYYEVTKPNYNTVTGSQQITINAKTIGLSWGETSFDCDESEKQPSVTATGIIDGDECLVTVEGSGIAVGSYTATATALSNPNYQLPTEGTSCPFTILRNMSNVFGSGCQWATYVAQEDLQTPEGVNAYVVSNVTTESVTVAKIVYIPAGVGVLLQRNDLNVTNYKGEAYTAMKDNIESKLVGNATTATEIKPFKDFVLYRDEFVLSSTNTATAGHAYLPSASVPANVRSLAIGINGDATTIAPLTVNGETWSCYDMMGHRLDKKPTAKGLYIINGKKVIVK